MSKFTFILSTSGFTVGLQIGAAMDNFAFQGDNCTTFIEKQNCVDSEVNVEKESVAVYSKCENENPRKYFKMQETIKANKILASIFPPTGFFAATLCLLLSTIAVFLVARCVLGEIASIGGTVFALMVLVVVALIGGQLVILLGSILSKLSGAQVQLPALLGMLIVGILLKNIPYNIGQFGRLECYNGTIIDTVNELDDIDEHSSWKRSIDDDIEYMFDETPRRGKRSSYHIENITHVNLNITDYDLSHCNPRYIGHELDPFISRTLRTVSLNVILLMAGLELNPGQLWNLSGMVLRATLIPCLVEATSVAMLAYFFLGTTHYLFLMTKHLISGFPVINGFLLGFVLAGVSPAVIIPSLIPLIEQGYGVAKGIPTLVIAACSADDVVAISGFGIFLGITFITDGNLLNLILHGPIELLIGLSFGIGWGLIAQYLPHRDHAHVVFFRYGICFNLHIFTSSLPGP